MTTNLAKYTFATGYHDAIRIVQECAGGLLVTGPGGDDWDAPEVRPVLEKYFGAAAPAAERLAMMKMIADLTVGDFGGYQSVLAVHAEGSIEAEKMQILREYDGGPGDQPRALARPPRRARRTDVSSRQPANAAQRRTARRGWPRPRKQLRRARRQRIMLASVGLALAVVVGVALVARARRSDNGELDDGEHRLDDHARDQHDGRVGAGKPCVAVSRTAARRHARRAGEGRAAADEAREARPAGRHRRGREARTRR